MVCVTNFSFFSAGIFETAATEDERRLSRHGMGPRLAGPTSEPGKLPLKASDMRREKLSASMLSRALSLLTTARNTSVLALVRLKTSAMLQSSSERTSYTFTSFSRLSSLGSTTHFVIFMKRMLLSALKPVGYSIEGSIGAYTFRSCGR